MILGGTIKGLISSQGGEVKVVRTSEDFAPSDESVIIVEGKVTLTLNERAAGRRYDIYTERGAILKVDAVNVGIIGGYVSKSGMRFTDESYVKIGGAAHLQLLFCGKSWHLSGEVFQ